MFILFSLLCLILVWEEELLVIPCIVIYLVFFVCVPTAPLGVIVVLLLDAWRLDSNVCYAEFSLLLCAEALVLRAVRGLKGTNTFFFFNSIKSSSGSRDVKEHEIRNVLTPVPVKRSYLCSRGLQILFFFLECFPPVTWCYYACWASQCQRVNTHRIVMEGHWRRLWAGPDQFVIVFKMNLLLTLLAAVVNTH